VHPPLANNYFSTFSKLAISSDFEVKIGFIINYIRDAKGVPVESQPADFDENVESVFAELDRKLRARFADASDRDSEGIMSRFGLAKVYDQFIFWFAHVLNEIQNGPACPVYARLISVASSGDTFVTFNWDTLLDKALASSGRWFPDDGYHVAFDGLLDGSWRTPVSTRSAFPLLKLHGSTNWLGPYVTRDLRDGQRRWVASKETVNCMWCLVDGSEWFPTYKDRWRPGYDTFSYFFPPNDPVLGAPLMPIIIPPTEKKNFGEYGQVFRCVWKEAERCLAAASRLVIIGYSFPPTDAHAFSLLGRFLKAKPQTKTIEIIDPYPAGVARRVRDFVGDRCRVRVHRKTLARFLSVRETKLQRAEFVARTIGFPLKGLQRMPSDEGHRLRVIVSMLIYCNLYQQLFDMTTSDGRRFLDCTIPGEFATHLYGAYRPEVLEYRLGNIPIRAGDGTEARVALSDIWILNPLKPGGISQKDMAAADVSKVDGRLKEMIRRGFHCRNKKELDYFLRRYIAS
jgi:hypothetical protein